MRMDTPRMIHSTLLLYCRVERNHSTLLAPLRGESRVKVTGNGNQGTISERIQATGLLYRGHNAKQDIQFPAYFPVIAELLVRFVFIHGFGLPGYLLQETGTSPVQLESLMDKDRDNMLISRISKSAPDRIRTCDRRFRKPLLYPLSYRSISPKGAGG